MRAIPVGWCGEHSQYDVSAVQAEDGAGRVQQIKVEVRVSGDGAVQSGLQKRCPLLLQHTLRTAHITLTHASHAGDHHLAHTPHRFVFLTMSGRRVLHMLHTAAAGT